MVTATAVANMYYITKYYKKYSYHYFYGFSQLRVSVLFIKSIDTKNFTKSLDNLFNRVNIVHITNLKQTYKKSMIYTFAAGHSINESLPGTHDEVCALAGFFFGNSWHRA